MNLGPILNAFPKKTRVTFIHALTGKVVGTRKVMPNELPGSFTKPTTIELEGIEWRVLQAQPIHAKEFTIDNKLVLHVQEINSIKSSDFGFDIPTICSELPEFGTDTLFKDFILELSENSWRKIELLQAVYLPHIQEQMLTIESILNPADGSNTLIGYKEIYPRKDICGESMAIPFDEFFSEINSIEKGAVCFPGNKFIQNGFVLRSENHTYYGIMKNNIIKGLCLESFDCIDEELFGIMSKYQLALTDWCNGKIILL